MTFNWKKILIIAGFVAVIVSAGFAIYYLFFKAPTPAPVAPIEQPTTHGQLPGAIKGTQPGATAPTTTGPSLPGQSIVKVPAAATSGVALVAQGGVTRVNDIDYSKTTSFALDKTGQGLLTYNPDTGKFYKLDAGGTKVSLSDRTYKGAENIAWSANQNKAILQFPDGSNILYDIQNDKQVTLPKTWDDFNFSASGEKIAFKDMSPYADNRWLAIANPDGSGQKYLEQMGDDADKFIVDWSPNNQVVAMYKNVSGGTADKTQVLLVGQNGENFPALNINGFGFTPKWTPDGSRLVYSASDASTDNKPMLYVVDASGSRVGYNHQGLGLNTWADKCSFADTNTLYCAVPKELPSGADFAPAIANNTPDYIYRVDLTSGVKSFVAEPEYGYTIDQITVSSDQSVLYFTDKATQAVHTIKLK